MLMLEVSGYVGVFSITKLLLLFAGNLAILAGVEALCVLLAQFYVSRHKEYEAAMYKNA